MNVGGTVSHQLGLGLGERKLSISEHASLAFCSCLRRGYGQLPQLLQLSLPPVATITWNCAKRNPFFPKLLSWSILWQQQKPT